MQNIRPGRLFLAVALVVSCVALGISAPLVFNFDAREIRLSNVAVFAAAREAEQILVPTEITPALRVSVEGGTIDLDPQQKARVRPDAAILQDGTARLIIDGGNFRIGSKEKLQTAGAVGGAALFTDAIRALNFQSLAIRNSSVEITLPDGHSQKLENVTAEVLASRRNNVTIRGTGNLRGQEVAFDISAPSVLGGEATASLPMKLRLKSPLIDMFFDGQVAIADTLGLQGRIEVLTSNLRDLARWFGAEWASGPGLKNADIRGDLSWQGPSMAFDKATFRMDGNDATGTLTLNMTGDRPAVTGTLAMKSLDLTPYFADAGQGDLLSNFLDWARTDQTDISNYLSAPINADLRLSAAQLSVGQWKLGRFAASLSIKNGRILADVAELGVDNGRASGQLTADLSGSLPHVGIRVKLEDFDAANASMVLLGRTAVHGLSNIAIDLTGDGQSVSELVNGARGKVTFHLNEGGRLGIDVKELLAAAQEGGVEGWNNALQGQTSVEGLEAKFRIDKGIMASEQVEVRSGGNLLKAMGTISLQSQQLDLRLLMDALPEAAAKKTEPDVLVLRGPWTAPSIFVER